MRRNTPGLTLGKGETRRRAHAPYFPSDSLQVPAFGAERQGALLGHVDIARTENAKIRAENEKLHGADFLGFVSPYVLNTKKVSNCFHQIAWLYMDRCR